VREPLAGDGQELAVGGDVHHRLRDAERDDLGVGHPATGVLRPLGQEIVSGAEHRGEQQVEVGEHRGPLGSTARLGTADLDLCSLKPSHPHPTVESII
jgi:hypothetical protein